MKYFVKNLLFFLFFTNNLQAQQPEIVVKSIETFEDKVNNLIWENAINNPNFSKNNKIPNELISQYKSSFWLKCLLINSANKPEKILFTSGNFVLSEIYIFKKKNLLKSIFNSKNLTFNQRPYPFDYQYFPIEIEAKDTLILLQKINDKPRLDFSIQPKIVSYNDEAQNRLKLVYEHEPLLRQNNSLVAIALFVALFVLIQFYYFRKRYLFYYFLYLISIACFAMYGQVQSPYASHILGLSDFLRFTLKQNFYFLITNLSYIYFIWSILDGDKLAKPWQVRVIKFQKIILFSLLFTELFSTVILKRLDYQFYIVWLSQIVLAILSFITTYIIIAETAFRKSKFIIIGSSAIAIALIYGILSAIFSWIPNSTELIEHRPNLVFIYLILFEILLYSLAIGEKIFEFFAEKSLLQRQVVNSELNTLRSQINPHFLFNSLNSIKDLIARKENIKAADYINNFADLMRKILENSKEAMISVQEELAFLEAYLQLESRKNSNLQYEIICPETFNKDEFQIPAMLLQPVVENCVKHAFGTELVKPKITIEILPFEKYFNVNIIDNGIGFTTSQNLKKDNQQHKSLGLELTKNRLKLIKDLYSWEITTEIIEKDGTTVSFLVPYFS